MYDIEIPKCDIKGEFSSPLIGSYGGSYSFAGMFFSRAAVNSSVICTNLNPRSEQSGTLILELLRAYGAKITRSGESVNVRAGRLRGCTVDVSEFPMLAPAVIIPALFAVGKTRITGFTNDDGLLQYITGNLFSLGVKCEYNMSDLWIWPTSVLTDAVLDAHNKTGLAMALILLSTCIDGNTVIRNVGALFTRYPEFAEIFRALGGDYKLCSFSL